MEADHPRGKVVKGKNGLAESLGHVLVPYQSIANQRNPSVALRTYGDLESLCSLTAIERNLLPYFSARYPGTNWRIGTAPGGKAYVDLGTREMRSAGIFRVQAHALGLFFDEMVNTFDPDALIGEAERWRQRRVQKWFMGEIRCGMPNQREEQAGIRSCDTEWDTAGARGAAIEALQLRAKAG